MIEIRNKLEILPGNKLVVPGCEPTSAFTSDTLAANRQCEMTVVDLRDALAVIPGAEIVSWSNPLRRFLVLPSGPPPSPDKCSGNCTVEDWYALLRSIGRPAQTTVLKCDPDRPPTVDEICSAFPLRGIF